MPDQSFASQFRIRAVEREHKATRLAMDRLKQQATDDPVVLGKDLRLRDIVGSSEHLDGTYLIRLFAEFETSLRHFLRDFGLPIPKSTEALVNRVRDRGGIPKDHAKDVHKVRDYRNTLLHDRDEAADPVTIRDATRFLCTYLSRLQRIW